MNYQTSKANYDACKKLNVDFSNNNWNLNLYPINECNLECRCNQNMCLNRVVQNGPYFNFEIFTCENPLKGKGLKTNEFIPMGCFVIEYLGEIIGMNQAKMLLKERTNLAEPNYIMFLKEFYSNNKIMYQTVIDARNYSNLGRYINHSCEPNLFILPVRINNLIPHAALFSLRDVYPGEELSYDYHGTIGIDQIEDEIVKENAMQTRCLCGSKNCRGFLQFSE